MERSGMTLGFLTAFLTITLLLCNMNFAFAAGEEGGSLEGKKGRVLVGEIEVITLSDGVSQRATLQQAQLLQGDKDKIATRLEETYPSGQMEATVNAFLINTGSKLVLVDTGNGVKGKPLMGHVVDNLRAAGYQPEEIDEIYLTHMHPDHIGGLSSDGQRVFSNATLYVDKNEADYWLNASNLTTASETQKRTFQAVKEMLTPYLTAGKFNIFDGNTQLTPGISAKELFGHTPGHVAYVVESKGETLILWGDVIHVAAVQFENPAVTIAYDSDQENAAKVRQKILREAAKNNTLVGGAHLAFPGIGHVTSDGEEGFKFVPID
ncbi:MBL fold metallo-hydrolase [Azotosporobacter soli]|uniref:MBL fold metallo-hydrolase n=1 Tax=Azotosporobacter soli TaxID=3055040 RepID=UPI0031FE671D